MFFLGREAYADVSAEQAIDGKACDQRIGRARQRAEKLAPKGDAADAAKACQPEDAAGDAAPEAANAMQRPDAEHVVDLELALAPLKHRHEEQTGDAAGDESAQRVHDIGAGADRDQPDRTSTRLNSSH